MPNIIKMISGDKADQKNNVELPQSSILKIHRRLISCVAGKINEDTDVVEFNDGENHLKTIDIIDHLAKGTVENEQLIENIREDIKEVKERLNEIKIKNQNLEKSIILKLKENTSVTEYCNIFDKYVTRASNMLDKIFKKFNEKIDKKNYYIENDLINEKIFNKIKNEEKNFCKNKTFTINNFLSYLTINNIHDLVEGMSPIGHGGEGRVYRAIMINSGVPVVVKSYFMDCEQSSRIEYSMLVLCQNVKGVKKPIGLFQTSANYYLIMEDDHKSIPLDVLAEKGILSENQIQHLFSQMVYILYDLRNKFIKHRDVKLDNFLLNTENGRLSIIDFGWAMYTAIDQVMIDEVKRSGETLMGTFDYLPPEADSPSGTMVSYEKATVYALGCILLELFFGYQGKIRNILAKETLHSFVNRMSDSKCKQVSKGAISILDRCLKININERLNLDDVILHPWVPSDKVDNSLFNNVNRSNVPSNHGTNTSLPCLSNRLHSSSSQ